MSKTTRIKWFLDQIPALTGDRVIDENTGKSLYAHYSQQLEQIKQHNRRNMLKPVLGALILLAAISIIGGITLIVVTYGWANIPVMVKTVFAFMMLLVPQGLCAWIVFAGKKPGSGIREGFSLALSIMFGISIAFIGQIYQLPSNINGFLVVWALSTLVVIYLFRSLSATVFYLGLTILHTSSMQYDEKIGLMFYLFIIALIPYYIIEYRKNELLRQKILDYFLVATIIGSLGITMEKAVPGLWIVAYANLFALLYLFGIVFERRENNSILMQPLKISGIVGIMVLGSLLLLEWPWEGVGWKGFRNEARFDQVATFFDYAICIIMPLATALLGWLAWKKEKRVNWPMASFGILAGIAWIIAAGFYKNQTVIYFISRSLFFYLAGLAIWGLHKGLFYKRGLLGSFSLLYLLVISVMVFIWENIYRNMTWMTASLSAPVLLYLMARLLEKREKVTFFTVLKVFSIISFGIILYTLSWFSIIGEFLNDTWRSSMFSGFIIIELAVALIIPVTAGVMTWIAHLRNRPANLLVSTGSGMLYILIAMFMLTGNSESVTIAGTVIVYLYIFSLGIYSLYSGLQARSLAAIVGSCILLFGVLVSRFFDPDLDILVKGFGLLFSGLGFVLVLFFFTKRINKLKEIDGKDGGKQ
jgi:uncharacterized membrane protein